MPFSHVLAIKLCTNNLLWKKSQGFVSAVSIMRDFVPAIYDTTVIVPKDSPQPTMLRILKGQSSVVCFLTSWWTQANTEIELCQLSTEMNWFYFKCLESNWTQICNMAWNFSTQLLTVTSTEVLLFLLSRYMSAWNAMRWVRCQNQMRMFQNGAKTFLWQRYWTI